MADAPATPPGMRRFLTFRSRERRYALPAEEVSEVIRIPPLARVPQAPPSLMGLGNLRGTVLAVASLRGLLGDDTGAATGRAIVLDGPAAMALAVDAVEGLAVVAENGGASGGAALAAEPGERLRGAFQAEGGREIVRILDIEAMLAATFVPRARPAAPRMRGARTGAAAFEAADEWRPLVTFDVAGQEYGMALADVQAITTAPDHVSVWPKTETPVLGVTAFREMLLPLLSLGALLGLDRRGQADERAKVIVTSVRSAPVGLVVDRMRDILRADAALIEATPSVLAARTGGEARVAAIYRGDGGRRLIPILAPDQLFREDVVRRLGDMASTGPARQETAARQAASEDAGIELQVLVFRLGEDAFALPIDAVDEVGALPDRIVRVPKTPKFLEGVVNLRGAVLPVVDQRRRFGMPPAPAEMRRRMIVVRSERHRAGLLVDGVSEVLRIAAEQIGPAPALTGEANSVVSGVINLERTGRIVLLLDPAELLSPAERGQLDHLGGVARQDGA